MTITRHIEGYAIISEDGMLADAARVMPESLKFQADARFFEEGLDGVPRFPPDAGARRLPGQAITKYFKIGEWVRQVAVNPFGKE